LTDVFGTIGCPPSFALLEGTASVMEKSVETWVNQQNLKPFRGQLDANGVQRTTLLGLLAREEVKAAEAKIANCRSNA
jgi:hypothetical protein